MNASKDGLIQPRIALVQQGPLRSSHAKRRAAIASEMFGRRQHCQRVVQSAVLQSSHGRCAQPGYQLRIFGETLISPSPALISGHRDTGRKISVDAGSPHLNGSDAIDPLYQRRIARHSEPDVVRKNNGALYVAVAMHRVDTIQQRNAQPRAQGYGL